MLLKKELLEKLDEQYRPMFKDVSIPDFTKCIAHFSGLHISEVADSAIEEYLTAWALNKYRFYKLFGNKLRYETQVKYNENSESESIRVSYFNELSKEFPAYALWLNSFCDCEKNKIEDYNLGYSIRRTIREIFPNHSIVGMTLTHFFKNNLSAPDELITKLGRIYENQEVEANYTISIDPVDMMTASENPYNWTSCYSLGNSHADGTLAAMLDDSSLITYVWNKEGDFCLANTYDFKHFRYKKMREYISISPSMNSIHFNDIYPGKFSYTDDFKKTLRSIVENFIDAEATWARNDSPARRSSLDWYQEYSICEREYCHGYGEFDVHNIYVKKGSNKDIWNVYNVQITCPCGCGNYLYGSDDGQTEDGDEVLYDGGFTYENSFSRHYCSIIDDYCDDYDGNCSCCASYNRENAKCELDEDHYCEGDTWIAEEDHHTFDPYDSNIVHCSEEFCSSCPFYALHHQKDVDAENDERKVAEGADQED